MSAIANKLVERRNRVWEQAKEVADRAAEENRALSGEEQGQWDSLNGELDALDERIKSYADQEARNADAEATLMGADGGQTAQGRAKLNAGSDAELRSFLRGEGPNSYVVRPSGPIESRATLLAESGSAANTVPTDFFSRLWEHMIENSAVLQTNPTVLNTSGGEALEIPKTTVHSTGAVVAEAGTFTADDPTFAKVTLNAFKYGRLVQISSELVSDTGVDITGYLARNFGRALGNTFGTHLVTGTGSGQPRGVVTASSLGTTGPTGVAGAFGAQSTAEQGFDTLINLFHSVIAPYRMSPSAYWLMNDQTAAKVRKIKDADGRYAWQPSVIVGQPDTILSKPVAIDPNVADTAVDAISVVFGDFSQYVVRIVDGFEFVRSDDFAFDQDLVTFRARLRGDADLVDETGAIKHFVGAAT